MVNKENRAFAEWCVKNETQARTSYLMVWNAACKWQREQIKKVARTISERPPDQPEWSAW